jgi:cytochrome c-type biogenesis protein
MLPMLPIYVSYFAAGDGESRRVLPRALAFVLGFTVEFSLLGLLAGTLGSWLGRYRAAVNIVCGVIVAALGLGYLEVLPLPFFRGMAAGRQVTGIACAFVFGLIYSVSLTPCVGRSWAARLMLASASGTAAQGAGAVLVVYSLGLGVPFVLSAALLKQLESAFGASRRITKSSI